MKRIFFFCLFVLLMTGCHQETASPMLEQLLRDARKQFAPDQRTAVFDVTYRLEGNNLILRGEILGEQRRESLAAFLRGKTSYAIVDSLKVLPDSSVGDKQVALVSVSVANLRKEPDHAAELGTQALLGTPVRVLKKHRGWWYVQTPDDYLGWTDGLIIPMSGEDYAAWVAKPKIIVTEAFGFAYETPAEKGQVVSDIVVGDLLALEKTSGTAYQVLYPDGRKAFLPKAAAQPFDRWLAQAHDTPERIVATAKQYMGIPYLWGGTSSKGFDCSGFTKIVYFLNGVMLPRDADQQADVGVPVATDTGFGTLQPGDLLFFGRRGTAEKPERITHVGISLGRAQFIHAPGGGGVTTNSLSPEDLDFSRRRSDTFIRARRIIGAGSDNGVPSLSSLPYYQSHER